MFRIKSIVAAFSFFGLVVVATPSHAGELVYSQDAIQFDGLNSGNGAIGASCTAGTYNACLAVTGATQDVTALIGSFISEGEICCGTSSVLVSINDSGIDTVTVHDDVYGVFFGTLASTDSGTADELNWASAVYGSPFAIDFTNSSGIITDVLFNVGSAAPNVSPMTDVPEPTSMALLGAGLLGMYGVTRRRQVGPGLRSGAGE